MPNPYLRSPFRKLRIVATIVLGFAALEALARVHSKDDNTQCKFKISVAELKALSQKSFAGYVIHREALSLKPTEGKSPEVELTELTLDQLWRLKLELSWSLYFDENQSKNRKKSKNTPNQEYWDEILAQLYEFPEVPVEDQCVDDDQRRPSAPLNIRGKSRLGPFHRLRSLFEAKDQGPVSSPTDLKIQIDENQGKLAGDAFLQKQILYNNDYDNIFSPLIHGRMQCSSGTDGLLYADYINKLSEDKNLKPYVLFTASHARPLWIRDKDQSSEDRVTVIESTSIGPSVAMFSSIAQLSRALNSKARAIKLKDYLLVHILSSLDLGARFQLCLIGESARTFYELEDNDSLDEGEGETSKEQHSRSISANALASGLGSLSVPEGDQQRTEQIELQNLEQPRISEDSLEGAEINLGEETPSEVEDEPEGLFEFGTDSGNDLSKPLGYWDAYDILEEYEVSGKLPQGRLGKSLMRFVGRFKNQTPAHQKLIQDGKVKRIDPHLASLFHAFEASLISRENESSFYENLWKQQNLEDLQDLKSTYRPISRQLTQDKRQKMDFFWTPIRGQECLKEKNRCNRYLTFLSRIHYEVCGTESDVETLGRQALEERLKRLDKLEEDYRIIPSLSNFRGWDINPKQLTKFCNSARLKKDKGGFWHSPLLTPIEASYSINRALKKYKKIASNLEAINHVTDSDLRLSKRTYINSGREFATFEVTQLIDGQPIENGEKRSIDVGQLDSISEDRFFKGVLLNLARRELNKATVLNLKNIPEVFQDEFLNFVLINPAIEKVYQEFFPKTQEMKFFMEDDVIHFPSWKSACMGWKWDPVLLRFDAPKLDTDSEVERKQHFYYSNFINRLGFPTPDCLCEIERKRNGGKAFSSEKECKWIEQNKLYLSLKLLKPRLDEINHTPNNRFIDRRHKSEAMELFFEAYARLYNTFDSKSFQSLSADQKKLLKSALELRNIECALLNKPEYHGRFGRLGRGQKIYLERFCRMFPPLKLP